MRGRLRLSERQRAAVAKRSLRLQIRERVELEETTLRLGDVRRQVRQRVVGADRPQNVAALEIDVIDQLDLVLTTVVGRQTIPAELHLRIPVTAIRKCRLNAHEAA